MKKYIQLTLSEFMHLIRSPFKIISLLLFLLAVIYACQNGYNLFQTHNREIMVINTNNEKSIDKMILQYEAIERTY